MILSVEIPDESGTGTARRTNTADFSPPSLGTNYSGAATCLITEYFPEGNVLGDLVLKFRFEDEILESDLRLEGISIYDPLGNIENINLIEELVFPESTFDGTAYRADIQEVAMPPIDSDYLPFLFLHKEEVYPKPGNETYIEGRPETPTDEPAQLLHYAS